MALGVTSMEVGRTGIGFDLEVAVCVVVLYLVVMCVVVMYLVVVCVLARRKRVKTMKMGVKNMVAVSLRWLVYKRMWWVFYKNERY